MMTRKNYSSISEASVAENEAGIIPEESVEDFEGIMEIVGSNGKYQKMLLYGILTPFSLFLPVFIMNTVFLYAVPDHWCHYDPAQENTTSLEEWKNLNIPRENGPDGIERFSQCEMYVSLENRTPVACPNGWDYDRTEFQDTMPAHFNWVCADAHYITQALVAGVIGSFLGTFILGWAGDKWGRKPTFFMCVILISVFRFTSLYVPGIFILYVVAEIFLSSAFPMIYLSLYSIAVEILDKEARSWIYGVRWSVWVCGLCLLPLVSWLTRDWFLLGTITSLPLLLTFCLYKFIPESPRWLLTQNKLEEAEEILQQIATTNGKVVNFGPGEFRKLLAKVKAKQDERNFEKERSSIWTLFSKRRLAQNTILISVSNAANAVIYYGITYRTTSLNGNQFINFFLLTIIELPAGWFGGCFAEKAGRRWTQAFAYFACSIGFGLTVVGTIFPNYSYLVIPALMVAKFFVSSTSMILPLQAAELFPTEHRAMGNGFAHGFAQFVNIGTPPILLLAQSETSLAYSAFVVIAFIGMLAASFLPETQHRSLPETIEEANTIGEGVPYWSFLPHNKNSNQILTNEIE